MKQPVLGLIILLWLFPVVVHGKLNGTDSFGNSDSSRSGRSNGFYAGISASTNLSIINHIRILPELILGYNKHSLQGGPAIFGGSGNFEQLIGYNLRYSYRLIGWHVDVDACFGLISGRYVTDRGGIYWRYDHEFDEDVVHINPLWVKKHLIYAGPRVNINLFRNTCFFITAAAGLQITSERDRWVQKQSAAQGFLLDLGFSYQFK